MHALSIDQRSALAVACLLLAVGLGGCRARPPRFQPPAGVYSCPAEVRLYARDDHSRIFYTTDGSTPTKSSLKYTGPFLVAQTATVKAIAQEEDDKPSKVRTEIYTCRPAVNRADIALLLQQAFNLPQPKRTVAYADLRSTDPVYPAAQALAPFLNRQVLCPNCLLSANFSPQRPTSRAEAAVALVSVLIAGKKLQLLSASSANSVLTGVPDAGSLPPFARRYVATAIQSGVLTLQSGNTLQPGQTFTHAELAASLNTIRTNFGPVVITAQ
jgi:Chitobiase/beta-hexosaminidase C-terminal domain/S-layer homology domain